MLQALEIAANKSGKRYALASERDGFVVYAECKNYQHGRIVASWRCCDQKMAEADARKLYRRKVSGAAK